MFGAKYCGKFDLQVGKMIFRKYQTFFIILLFRNAEWCTADLLYNLWRH